MIKPLYILVAAFILVPPIVYTGAFFYHPVVKVGILRDQGCELRHAYVSLRAFDIYPGCFEAQVLPETFNVSDAFGPDNECYPQMVLNLARPEEMRRKYGVDVVIILINETLMASYGEDRGIGGKADTPTGAGIVSVAGFTSENQYNKNRIKHITMHETFHLLGYMHDRWGRKCVMNTAENKEETRMNYFYEFQLPVRLWVYHLGIGQPFPQAAFITSFANFLLWMPYFIGMELVLFTTYQKHMNNKGLPFKFLLLGLLGSAVMMGTMFDAMWFIAGPLCLMAFVHHYHYTWVKIESEPVLKFNEDDEESGSEEGAEDDVRIHM